MWNIRPYNWIVKPKVWNVRPSIWNVRPWCREPIFTKQNYRLGCDSKYVFPLTSMAGMPDLPKLGALCRVISRITRVPKHDHISKNCLAMRRNEPTFLALGCNEKNSERKVSMGCVVCCILYDCVMEERDIANVLIKYAILCHRKWI